MTKTLVYLLNTLTLMAGVSTFGAEIAPQTIRSYVLRETINNHFEDTGKTEIQPQYMAGGPAFSLPFIRIPRKDVEIVDSGLGNAYVQSLLSESPDWIQFPIHPESYELYKPLIHRHGLENGPEALATSSTRSLMLPEVGVGVKVSIEKKQFGLGRVVPDWEIRRSVGISRLAALTSQKEWFKNKVSLIPDVMGVYVKSDHLLEATVDDKQPVVFEHGVLYRDLEFLNQLPQYPKFPLFALFSSDKGDDPILIKKWKQSELSFYDYVEEAILKPIISSTAYLVFHQGIVPEMHGQNLVVAVDPHDGHIQHVFHRDTGSMKVDLRLRIARGLSVDGLRSFDTKTDFKFWRATFLAGSPLYGWFYSYMFTDFKGMAQKLKKYFPEYDPNEIKNRMDRLVALELNRYFPDDTPMRNHHVSENLIYHHIERWLSQQRPPIEKAKYSFSERDVLQFLNHQLKYRQVHLFPEGWYQFHSEPWITTKFGILFDGSFLGLKKGVYLAPYTNEQNPISIEKHPNHYETTASAENIFTTNLLKIQSVSLAEYVQTLKKSGPIAHPKAIRLQIDGKPVFKLVSGEYWALAQVQNDGLPKIEIEVVADLSHLDKEKQINFLKASHPLVAKSSASSSAGQVNPWTQWSKALFSSCASLLSVTGP